MNKQTVEILKKEAPQALLGALKNVLSKEEYQDGYVSELYGNMKEEHDIYSVAVQIIDLSEHYNFGEKDLSLLEKAKKYVHEKEEKEEKELEKETIEYWIAKGDKEKIKETAKKKANASGEIPYYEISKEVAKTPKKKTLVLQVMFELFEEGYLKGITKNDIEVVMQQENERFEEILSERNDFFKKQRKNMEYLEKFSLYYHDKISEFSEFDEHDVEQEEYYRAFSFRDLIKNTAPALNEMFKQNVFKNENWENIKINEVLQDELNEMKQVGYEEDWYVVNVTKKESNLGEFIKYLTESLQSEVIEYSDIQDEYTEEVMEFIENLKENMEDFEVYTYDKKRIWNVLSYMELVNGKHQNVSDQNKKDVFSDMLLEEVYYANKDLFVEFIKKAKENGYIQILKDVIRKHNETIVIDSLGEVMGYFFEEEAKYMKEKGIKLGFYETRKVFNALLNSN